MRRLSALLAAALLLVSGQVAVAQDSLEDARAEREEVRQEKADAAASLDSAKADDDEVAQALQDITDSVNSQQLELDDAQRQLDVALGVADEAQAEVDAADDEREVIEARLGDLAVAGFLNGSDDQESIFFAAEDPTEATRQATMLQLADTDAVELLEELRGVIEDRQVAEAVAQDAVDEAKLLELEMADILLGLEDQQRVQAELKAEMELRVQAWQAELDAIRDAEQELTDFIREEEAKLVPPPPPPNPSAPSGTSATGFQWPVSGTVTSEYGYRIHPIFGTRRLHAGMDISGPTGTAIWAAKGGSVIYAGWRGGYGNAVIINHGGGVTTLYAHQSEMLVSVGDQVGRGDVIGKVGSTGNSTGPHLHFEVRINGTATDPRPYLP